MDEMKKMLDTENDAKLGFKKQYEDMKEAYELLQKDVERQLKNNSEVDQLKQMLEDTSRKY